MKMLVRFSLALLVAAGCLVQAQSWAEEKKDKAPEKKKEAGKDITINGEITNADLKDKVRTDSFCKTYKYKMIEGKTYQIDMTAVPGVLDPYLRLEDGAGKQVAEDDDGGEGLNARIVYKAPKTG